MESNITAIINIYKRTYVLESQIKAIREQSIPPKSIIILNNGNKDVDLTKYKNDAFFKVFDCNFNSGVWSRFLISQLADTEYICIFDDDTIPGNNWFKNCMNSMNQKEALYGTIGLVFKDKNKYDPLRRYGWDSANNGNNTVSKPVDIVGHSWFFKKDWICYFNREPPKVYEQFTVGEDINFSYMLQKYANIPTYVPPHPSNDMSLFGSIPKTAWEYGCDGNSGSCLSTTVYDNFDYSFREVLKNGFNTLIKRQNATSTSDFNYFLNKIRNHNNFALIRPADGEYQILQNTTLTNIDKWTFNANGKLFEDLTKAIQLASNKNCYVGIPCGCCGLNMAKWYISTFNLNPLHTTFANVFVNKNWKNWVNFLINEKIPFTYIGPSALPSNFVVQKCITIPLYLVNEWDVKRDEVLSFILNEINQVRNKIFLFSAGPISKILISHAWNQNPNNIYLDIGSSLDIFTKGSTNRDYALEGSRSSQLECKFDSNLIEL
jgi:hypothetical protein